MFVIFLKEVRSYFLSPLFYFLAFIFTTFLSARFLPTIFSFAQRAAMPENLGGGANIHFGVFMVHLNMVYLIMLFLTPLITMKLLSEEKKERTLDLLLTAPVSSAQIILGKFFAAWFALSFLLFLALLYPLFMTLFVQFDVGPLWGSYLGMFLMLGLNAAIGLFASSLTSSALLSSFLGLLMILAVMLSGSFSGKITHPFWSALVEQLSLVLHIQDFFSGTLDTSGILFFITSLALFCFLSQRVLESSRWR